jgi:hypothetical protein
MDSTQQQKGNNQEGEKKKKSLLRRPWLWPLIPYFVVRWIARGGIRWLWDEFLCHLFLTFEYDSKGKPKAVHFVTLTKFIHFHISTWSSWLLLGLMMAFPDRTIADVVGLTLLGISLYSFVVVFLDFPFKRFVAVGALLLLLPLTDLGLSVGSKLVDNLLAAWNLPRLASWGERGVIFPLRDFLLWLDTSVGFGFALLWSIGWSGLVLFHLVNGVMFTRFTFDGERLYRWEFGAGDNSKSWATYYRGTSLAVTDMLEAIFGFASLQIGVEEGKGEAMNLENIPFLAFRGRRAKVNYLIARHDVEPGERGELNDENPGQLRIPHRAPGDAGADCSN